MKKNNDGLLLIGGGGHARDIYGLIDDMNQIKSVSLSVNSILDDEWENTERFRGCAVELVKGIKENLHLGDTFIICIGYPKNRVILTELAIEGGLVPHEALIHPNANVSNNCKVGAGSIILGVASLSPNVVIGQNSYISHGVLIGHDTIIGDNVSIMPGANISGDVIVGSNVLIGSGATILEKMVIGDGAVVGAASLVTRDVGDGATVVGVPAKEKP